jgi:hypothetical protein
VKKKIATASIIAVILVLFFTLTGLFVIQPIGAIPKGGTIWYLRAGTNFRFIESADGLSMKYNGGVSLMSRMLFMGKATEIIMPRKILQLPYIAGLYSISTGGTSFDQ